MVRTSIIGAYGGLLLLAVLCSKVESLQSFSPISRQTMTTQSTRLVPAFHQGFSSNAFRHQRLAARKDSRDDFEDVAPPAPQVDKVVKETALLLRRLSWGAWWAQLVLTSVASVTLLFARNVIRQSNASIRQTNSVPNFLLAGTGIVVSIVSLFWTWASRRLSRRLLKKKTSRIQAANMLRKAIKIGVTLNLAGMLCTIVGAEQIVGALAIKVLTAANTISLVDSSSSLLQPLDILVVQANTNTLFSHFCSLVALLYLSRSISKLDPPSIEGDERKR